MSDQEPIKLILAPEDRDRALLTQTLTDAQADFLLQRTPPQEIKTRQGRGGVQMSYVEHGYVTERLNLVFGFNWDFVVEDKQILDDEVIVLARLTVRTPAGQTIIKTQFGGNDIKRFSSGAKSGKPLSIADDYKAAASDALKKCASLLGIGLDLYGRDMVADPDEAPPEPRPARAARQPQPRTEPTGALTPKQQFNAVWKDLRNMGWTDTQISTQYKLHAGTDAKFDTLDGGKQAYVLEQLEAALANEIKASRGRK